MRITNENFIPDRSRPGSTTTATGHTEARLVNGSDSCSGRVELQYLSEWGTVCAVGWDMRAADVLCAQLDCGSAVAVVEVDWFVEGSGHIWADVFDCQGNETHLSQCGISSWSRAACSHKHDAGVICNGSSMAFHEGRVRLSGGSECQGEVEIYFRQEERKVLLDSWSLSEASVLCRQLGCGSVLNFISIPSTTEHKHMCVTAFSCSGSEAHLGNCSSAQAVNCTSGEHLYITCSEFKEIRLTGGCEGNLEVFYNGTWGNVCHNQMEQEIETADMVMKRLYVLEGLMAQVMKRLYVLEGLMAQISENMKVLTDDVEFILRYHGVVVRRICIHHFYNQINNNLHHNSQKNQSKNIISIHPSTGSLCVGNAALPGLSASGGTVLPEQSAQERRK
ncbi:scavenger receptor cysteine-rich type 1 protein M130-like isoform X1 [Silurus meridionalis]|nr:scavenger receptor cysteine-rich type 1 protein M130-like isoform X1 [Silurus meridionalis]